MIKATVVVGNPKLGSRTAEIAQRLVSSVCHPATVDIKLIELAERVDELFVWPSQSMNDLSALVAKSDLLVVASPTYKATYTGLLKSFLDRYSQNGLANVTTLALMTGSGMGHSLAPNIGLVPLLNELGASAPVGGLYFDTDRMDEIDDAIERAAKRVRDSIRKLEVFCNLLSKNPVEP